MAGSDDRHTPTEATDAKPVEIILLFAICNLQCLALSYNKR